MKRILQKYRAPLLLVLGLVLYCVCLRLLRITCPIKALLGVSCPGCGMTRALLSCLRLDFAAAFHYHPLFWAVVPVLCLLFFFHVRKNRRGYAWTLGISIALLLLVYLLRMLLGAGDVVVFDPASSWIYRLWQRAAAFLSR